MLSYTTKEHVSLANVYWGGRAPDVNVRNVQEIDGRAIACNNARQMVERPEGEVFGGDEAPRKAPGLYSLPVARPLSLSLSRVLYVQPSYAPALPLSPSLLFSPYSLISYAFTYSNIMYKSI